MIEVTRFNGRKLVINAELVKFVESTPDTLITLTTNDRILIKDKVEEVVEKIIQYQRLIRNGIEKIKK
ncbi:MAG TPA: flagellar protein FlbD [Candidatus Aerophobetes bacterium]|uniref:Flagellar protein FlbD n=1 Tax=Aerophobetes bacterium TaxID=2030807 RepID=A0A662DJ29_UNCAE|nr:MAG: flagellar protein FlbD [Candidatus Aerophobetes bacterium]HDN85112.1 flagellar protein FlbD [Candidatus Aerophobetes bacterium]